MLTERIIDGAAMPVAKVIDFGLSRLYDGSKIYKKAGTPFYISPEILDKNTAYGKEVACGPLVSSCTSCSAATLPSGATMRRRYLRELKLGFLQSHFLLQQAGTRTDDLDVPWPMKKFPGEQDTVSLGAKNLVQKMLIGIHEAHRCGGCCAISGLPQGPNTVGANARHGLFEDAKVCQ